MLIMNYILEFKKMFARFWIIFYEPKNVLQRNLSAVDHKNNNKNKNCKKDDLDSKDNFLKRNKPIHGILK